jgi:hypothetical protein
MCSDGRWISGSSLCDGHNNCGDWLDELYCDTSRGFSCPDQQGLVSWFQQDQLCDGAQDCRDGQDELYNVCQWKGFNCSRTPDQWVVREKLCDGVADCEHAEDEEDCRPYTYSWRYRQQTVDRQ